MTVASVPGSFRDPSGFLFTRDGELFRQINASYKPHYEHLVNSGLNAELTKLGYLIPHTEVELSGALTTDAYRVIKPQLIPFVTYPYEWSFHQLKAAAQLTLKIQQLAFEFGMVLKDASAYNVQFLGSKPVFIDTLSFEIYEAGRPWVAYKQFCEHFLAPLTLMSYVHVQLSNLMQTNIAGISLDLAAKLLPLRAKTRPSIFTHIVLHARTQARFSDSQKRAPSKQPQISPLGFKGLIENLERTVTSLSWRHPDTEWGGYYEDTNYVDDAMAHKKATIRLLLGQIEGIRTAVDAGANTGVFSEIAKEFASNVLSLDIDPVAVDKHFLQRQQAGDESVLPLRIDLTTPSPAIGWHNHERMSILQRAESDVVLALALIHHLAISNNVPLEHIARLFSELSPRLIIEFVPKSDSQVKRLLISREDIFPEYTQPGFEQAFEKFFHIEAKEDLQDSERSIYLMIRR